MASPSFFGSKQWIWVWSCGNTCYVVVGRPLIQTYHSSLFGLQSVTLSRSCALMFSSAQFGHYYTIGRHSSQSLDCVNKFLGKKMRTLTRKLSAIRSHVLCGDALCVAVISCLPVWAQSLLWQQNVMWLLRKVATISIFFAVPIRWLRDLGRKTEHERPEMESVCGRRGRVFWVVSPSFFSGLCIKSPTKCSVWLSTPQSDLRSTENPQMKNNTTNRCPKML